jgi:selenocysteine lyase/cysteine desulfurase
MDGIRQEIAQFVGASKEEIALTHNATESMGLIANGLDLKAGDEVLMTDQEHPSGRGPWLLKQARTGIRVREVKIPVPPKSSAELLETVIGAIRPETKVLSFSGITTHTGLLFPVAEICRAARAKGVITVVDGAHMPGQVALDIGKLECDLFAASLHKWLLTPPGCGFLYVRQDFQDRLWPTIVVDGWQKQKDALKYMQLGCNNRAELEGVVAAIRFYREIGAERVRARIHALAQKVYARASELPYLKVLSATDANLYGGMIAFEGVKKDYAPLWKKLDEKKVWTLRGEKIRVSTHIHTRPTDIDLLFNAIREAWG